MIKNERQYKITKAKLEKWLKTLDQVRTLPQPGIAEWVVREQMLAVQEQVKQLQSELKEYEDTASGAKTLPDPSLVNDIPSLLISWRIARQLTQRQLAERAGINENLLQKYEAENYGCAAYNTIVRIARVLKEEQCSTEP
jgi:ribosome-binding protein aMBF1 (putative translation factor)